MTIIQADIDAALKHLGWDDYNDFCAWALSNNEMNRFDDLAQAFAAHREAAEARAFEAGAKAMREVLDALSKAGPIHAGPVGGDLGRKYPDARQCVVEFAPGQGGGAYDLHSALVRLRAALDPAQIVGDKP